MIDVLPGRLCIGVYFRCYVALAMLHVVENITSAFDRKEFVMAIFLDLSKAFYTVDHNILKLL